jgi:hypothetical protein
MAPEHPGSASVKAGTQGQNPRRVSARTRQKAGSAAQLAPTPRQLGPRPSRAPHGSRCTMDLGPRFRVAVSRALALAVAGALFRFGGVLVIRYRSGGLFRRQVHAAAAPKGQDHGCFLLARWCAFLTLPTHRHRPSGEETSALWVRFSLSTRFIHPFSFR